MNLKHHAAAMMHAGDYFIASESANHPLIRPGEINVKVNPDGGDIDLKDDKEK